MKNNNNFSSRRTGQKRTYREDMGRIDRILIDIQKNCAIQSNLSALKISTAMNGNEFIVSSMINKILKPKLISVTEARC